MNLTAYPAIVPRAVILAMASMLAGQTQIVSAADQALSTSKEEHFDEDPGWEGYNNRNVPKEGRKVEQDFGYNKTQFASTNAGEVGGRIQRSGTVAYYAAPLMPTKTLDDKLTASGTFTASTGKGKSGAFFGFFNSQQPGESGRPMSSLGMEIGINKRGGRLAVRLITSNNKSCGTFVTPFIPGKFRPTPVKVDGTRYRWTLDYDPHGAGGNGRFTFTLHSDTHKTEDYGKLPEQYQKEADARFPNTTTFSVDVPPELRKENATFDRFGLCNTLKLGGTMAMYFSELEINGQTQDLSKDPGWIGVGNRTNFEDFELVGAHDYGYSAKTSFAGGSPGEVGGTLWRGLPFSYYADRVGPLNLDQRLEASGKVKLVTAGPDSDILLGWFNSTATNRSAGDGENFVGIHVGGPTRVGHYFIPVLATAKGSKSVVKHGPIIIPGKAYDWRLIYDPAANAGNGEMRVNLGSETVTLPLKLGEKPEGAILDRFGLFNSTTGGQMVKIYLDDLKYTTR